MTFHLIRFKLVLSIYNLNEIDKLLGNLPSDAFLRLDGGRAQVRRADDARVSHETPGDAALLRRLANEHVERRSLAPAGCQSVEQRLLVHYSAASNVNNAQARLAPLKSFDSN